MLIDCHAHLDYGDLPDYRSEITQKIKEGNPNAVIDTAFDVKSSFRCATLADVDTNVFSAVGVHPEAADEWSDKTRDDIAALADKAKNVAIGEIGLDYHYDNNPPKDVQKKAFVEQIELAYEKKLPVVAHIRDAHGDAVQLLKENKQKLYYGLLVHCYSGSKELMVEYNRLDAYYSYGGVITFKNAKEKPAIVRNTPLDRILLETDCPYMTPVPFRGQVNFPSYVSYVADKVSEILGKTREEIENITTENALRLFGKMRIV